MIEKVLVLNRDSGWRMFTLQIGEGFLRRWSELGNIDVAEIPVLAAQYYLGAEDNRRYYRVAWVDPFHRHFGAVFEEENGRERSPA